MNWDIVKGNWKEFKGKMQEEWGELSGDELDRTEGQREQVVGLVQQKYGWAKDDAERKVDEWAAKHDTSRV